MQRTAATTANIKIRPAIAIPMAKLRCDMQRASSGDCWGKDKFRFENENMEKKTKFCYLFSKH